MGLVDYLVIGLYFLSVLCLGFRYRHQKTTKDYFLGGRKIGGLLVGISVTVTLCSAITMMGMIAFVFQSNLKLIPGLVIGLPITIPIITRLIIPFYRRLPIITGYEYLEHRFNASVRTTASVLFVLMRLFYLAVVIYAPSVALTVVTGWPLQQNILLMGTVSITIAATGGMRAVIWSELIKFIAIVVSLCAILTILWVRIDGGIGEVINIAREGGRLEAFDFSTDPNVTFGFWAILLGGFFQQLSAYGADQITIQRYLASSSLAESQKSYRFSVSMLIPINILIASVGIGIYAFYQQNPVAIHGLSDADYVLPFFAVHELPAGLSGLVIATIFSMALTTHSSGLHSVNTTIINDWFRRSNGTDNSPDHSVRTARIGVIALGVFTLVAALYISQLGIIIIASKKITLFFGGVLLGIFLLGMCFRRASAAGGMVGMFIGMSTVITISQLTSISFFWFAPIGTIITVLSGYFLSLALPCKATDTEKL